MKQAIDIALRTWYPNDHPLHLNPHHPLGKLLGEWGELLDDFMKSLYKPGYVFDPEDELGDIWYYLRILCYQKNYNPTDYQDYDDENIDYIIASTMQDLAAVFRNYQKYHPSHLDRPYTALVEISKRYNLTFDHLTASNWQKLKPGSERGEEWMKARER